MSIEAMKKQIIEGMNREIERSFYGSCTYSNSEASTITRDSIIDSMKRLMACKPVPPPIRIVTNPLLTETKQTKFPKKRNNRRWTKKYAKKYTINVPSASTYYLKDQGLLVCHPAMKAGIEAAIRQRELENHQTHRRPHFPYS